MTSKGENVPNCTSTNAETKNPGNLVIEKVLVQNTVTKSTAVDMKN